jgi:aspartyl aminopeptidase
VRPGDRLMFVHRGRTALLVVVGRQPLARAGARLIAAHIDAPAPRLALHGVTERNQGKAVAHGYGGLRGHHWSHLPLAVVGRVARVGGDEIDVELGLHDDFALYVTGGGLRAGLEVTFGSAAPAPGEGDAAAPVPTLLSELAGRYGLTAADLEAAELYLVPRARAREVGLDRALIGGHGQDDRVNAYAAWRAIVDLPAVPERTAMVWLVDREEVGSTGPTGARSHLLELSFAWLLRAQGTAATETTMGRALAATVALSADTPAGINPNWPEVHDPANAPRLGAGPALFPFTGRGGKQGGSAAGAELTAAVTASFARAGAPLQTGTLGKVDEGGGGTVAKYLAERGIDVIDIGVCVLSMHSPMELSAKDDIWAAYRGFRAWLAQ